MHADQNKIYRQFNGAHSRIADKKFGLQWQPAGPKI
jgi:hypothetical protein